MGCRRIVFEISLLPLILSTFLSYIYPILESENQQRRRNLQHQREELNKQLVNADQDVKGAKEDLKQKQDRFSSTLGILTTDRDAVQRGVEALEQLQQKVQGADLSNVLQELTNKQALIAENEEQIRSLSPQMNALNAEISSQERTKRLVKDNIDLRLAVKEFNRLGEELKVFERVTRDGDGKQGSGNGEKVSV